MVQQKMLALCGVIILLLKLVVGGYAEKMDTINGTIYCDNDFTFYVNGEFIVKDPVPITPHGAVNVSFTVPHGKNIVFAIEGRDWADNITGLEYGDRCIGDGGLRAIFSNGVVTNSSWVCTTHHYGPVNWKKCFGAQTLRNQSLQLLPACSQNTTIPLNGCTSRITPKPSSWTNLDFDDSRWDYALEYTEDIVGYGLPPMGCKEPCAIVSNETDPNGEPITCPQNLDWGDSKFIWRPDLDLDNTILCRYTLKIGNSVAAISTSRFIITVAAVLLILSQV